MFVSTYLHTHEKSFFRTVKKGTLEGKKTNRSSQIKCACSVGKN